MRKITTKNFSQQVSLPFIQMEVVPRDNKVEKEKLTLENGWKIGHHSY